jgi:hypothetical protein
MKRSIVLMTVLLMSAMVPLQRAQAQSLEATVAKLDKAATPKEYQQLAKEFANTAAKQPNEWLTWYYAAYCNARTAWLYQDDGDKIEPLANEGEAQIKKALALLDTATQKKELSEVYVVFSMVNRAKVFINPATYGRQYGPAAGQYVQMAKKANADNPRALYLEGWEKYATPKMWGGDKKKAKELLEQSLQQLNAQTASGTQPHWGKQEVEALLKELK